MGDDANDRFGRYGSAGPDRLNIADHAYLHSSRRHRRHVRPPANWSVSLAITLIGSVALSAVAYFGTITPISLLAFCFIIGSGMALFGPAWQSSVNEQVSAQMLPAAIALNSISYNIARSFGPAIGGIIVAAAGSVASFLVNALAYVPLLIVLYLWRRKREPSRLPPERLNRAIVSGVPFLREPF